MSDNCWLGNNFLKFFVTKKEFSLSKLKKSANNEQKAVFSNIATFYKMEIPLIELRTRASRGRGEARFEKNLDILHCVRFYSFS